MPEPQKDLFELLVDKIRAVVREEINTALKIDKQPSIADKEWLKAAQLSELYGLPTTWFEARGREGLIERSKPGRYVVFKRRDVEKYLETHRKGKAAINGN